MNEEHFNILRTFIQNREQARIAKEEGKPKPWTSDKIIQNYRFCNVDRCNDKQTKWIINNLIKGFPDSEDNDTNPMLWFNLVLARFLNWYPTMEELGMPFRGEWNPKKFVTALDERQARGEQIYSGAYMIRGEPGKAGDAKHHYLSEDVFTPLWRIRGEAPYGGDLDDWADFFNQIPVLRGNFMTNQVITDMRYSSILANAKDWRTFLLPGPGTRRGMNRLSGRDTQDMKVSDSQITYEVLQLRDSLQKLYENIDDLKYLVKVFEDPNNVSNCLCELDKYCRVYYNERARPKSKYPGEKEVSAEKSASQVAAQTSDAALAKQRAAAAKRPKIPCEICGKLITKNGYSLHVASHTYPKRKH